MSCHPFFYIDWKEITKGYGWLEYDPKSQAYHPGFDYNHNNGKGADGDLNYPVQVCKRGITTYARNSKTAYGLMTIIEHEDGTYSKYAHLNEILVTEGQMVEEGEVIGRAGKSGTSSVHCHHELMTNELVSYLKKIRPTTWYTFYPKGRSKAWVAKMYINPLQAHTYPPPKAEIKKNMKVKLLISNPMTTSGLWELLRYVKDFWADLVNIEFNASWVVLEEVPFEGDKIKLSWLAQNIVPLASGYDVVCLWLPPEKWKNFDNERGFRGYAVPDKILGVQCIYFATTIGSTDTRWVDVPGQNDLAGKLRHELSHTLYPLTGRSSQVNNTLEYVPGDDNTHYFDFVVKDLSQVKKDIDMSKFEGWKPKVGTRMFSYAKPTYKKQKFSGLPIEGNVYVSTDNRMFFRYTNYRFRAITEQEYTTLVKAGAPHVFISVAEANYLCNITEVDPPELKTKIIRYELALTPARVAWLKFWGWTEEIPTKHLL